MTSDFQLWKSTQALFYPKHFHRLMVLSALGVTAARGGHHFFGVSVEFQALALELLPHKQAKEVSLTSIR